MKAEKFFLWSLYLSFALAYLSISLFQLFLGLAILSGFYIAWKKGINPFKGLFSFPLLGHISTITLSSVLFLRVKEQWRRLLEQDFYTFSYFIGNVIEREKIPPLVEKLIQITILLGWVLSIKTLYSYYFHHDYKGFWGGNFVVGNLLALPTFGSLYFFFHKRDWKIKIFYLLSTVLFLYVSFLPVERSVILGYLLGLTVFGIALVGYYKRWKTFLGIFLVFLTLLGVIAYQSPKVKWWFHLLTHKGNELEVLNHLSSQRVLIAKGAIELVEDAIKRGDYLKLLIGWGYGPQKQYKNLPGWLQFINEYESFVFLTEFINGGIVNLIFVLWFYIASILLTVRVLKKRFDHFWVGVVLVSSIWVNLGYHLFTLFWVPVNGLFYILLKFAENLTEKG